MSELRGFHIHIYFEPGTDSEAEALALRDLAIREWGDEMIEVDGERHGRVGHFHRQPVGPHLAGNFLIWIWPNEADKARDWVDANRGNLNVMMHKVTDQGHLDDHSNRVMTWDESEVKTFDPSIFKTALALLIAFIIALPMNASADLYLNKNAQPSTSLQAQPMPGGARGDNSLRSFANQFRRNCVSKENPVLRGQDLENMCTCTAAHIVTGMTQNDVSVFQQNNLAGKEARKKMMLNVYAPCLEFPAKAVTRYNCLNTPELQSRVSNIGALCGCVADGVGSYIGQNGPAVMQDALTRNPNTIDPLQALVSSNDFNQRSQSILMSCITKGF